MYTTTLAGDKEGGSFLLEDVLSAQPEDMVTIKNLGTIQYLLNEYKEAEKFLNLWLGKTPTTPRSRPI